MYQMIIGTSHKYFRQISKFLVLSAESGQRYLHNSKIRSISYKTTFLLEKIILCPIMKIIFQHTQQN